MKFFPHHRQLALSIAAVAVLVAGLWFGRLGLGGWAVRAVLQSVGGAGITLRTVEATPWRVVVEDLDFRMRTQGFAARRVTFLRPRWWRPTLGVIRIEGGRVAVPIDGSDVNPWQWATYDGATADPAPLNLPFESVAFAGELVVQAAGLPDRVLDIKLESEPKGGATWIGSLVASGPGFSLAGGGSLRRAGQELDFQVHSAELDLQEWQGQIQRLVLLPGGPWRFGGKLTGVAEGRVTANRFAATARVSLHDGWMRAGTQDIAARGAEAELEFADLWKLRTKSGVLHLAELRVGRLPLREITVDFGLWGGQTVNVKRANFAALGGRVGVGPFNYFQSQRELVAALQVEGLDLPQLAEIAPDLPGHATGRVDGALTLRVHEYGVRVDAGRLTLRDGTPGAMEINPASLLRSDATMSDSTVAALKSAASGPLRLRLRELQLEIRPPGLPLGCSARLQAAGESSEGPVAFDLVVNGALERYLDVLPGSLR